ncbi:hypothetical protein F7R91_21885 [Streptomyces luteolifulvus]|uniref:Uncharacterized protein n=1 Tax=Streptomyces luteolifulvus TaxID=2615112 RepID=A0A6H9UXH6_9ACTN|nr:hypothetical protein [Streptomyces luteolifulvus]KAB1144468.1 hypothetical protein F7R91_21885 [Streptomyces luteolifulvus]
MPAAEQPASADALAAAHLKSTAKWLVGASASTAAVIVAGLQLTSLDKLGAAHWRFGVLALGSAAVALGAAFRVLYQAVMVIGAPRPPIRVLDRKDRADHGNHPNGPRFDPPDSPLIHELVIDRRTELLGPGRDAIGALTDDYTTASRALTSGARVTIRGRTYDPRAVAADSTALQALSAELERRIRDVSDAAERIETERAYRKLKGQLAWHEAAFLLGIFLFAWLTILYPHSLPDTAKVTAPVQVDIVVPSESAARHAGLGKGCVGTLSGVEVGGTLDAPIVVTRSRAGCPAHRLGDAQGLVVVPAREGTSSARDLIILPGHHSGKDTPEPSVVPLPGG